MSRLVSGNREGRGTGSHSLDGVPVFDLRGRFERVPITSYRLLRHISSKQYNSSSGIVDWTPSPLSSNSWKHRLSWT